MPVVGGLLGHLVGEDVAHEVQVTGERPVGGQRLGVALEVQELLGDEDQLLRAARPHGVHHRDDPLEHLAEAHLGETGVEHPAERHRQASTDLLVGAGLVGEGADALEGTGDAGEVTVEHRRAEEVLEQVAPVVRDLAHDPEVEVGGPTVVEHPEVPGVHVAVEAAVHHRGLEPHLHPTPQGEEAVDAPLGDGGEVVHRHARHPLHADHVRTAVVPVHLGRGDVGVVAERGDALPEPVLPPRLERRVELLERVGVEVGHHARRGWRSCRAWCASAAWSRAGA